MKFLIPFFRTGASRRVEFTFSFDQNNSGVIVIVLLVIGGATGGYFYINKSKNKKPVKSGVDPDADYNEDVDKEIDDDDEK